MKCPICDSHHTIKEFSVRDGEVLRCCDCGHAFTKVSDTVDIASIYNEKYYLDSHKNWFENPDVKLFAKVKDIILEKRGLDASVIDVGCGNGSFLQYLYKSNFRDLTGIDFTDNSFDGIDFIKGDINDITFDKSYDVVVSLAVIEHIIDASKYVQKLREITNGGGIIILMTVNEDALLYRLARLFYKFGLTVPVNRLYEIHHVNHYSKNSLTRICRKHNLKVDKHFSTNFPVNAIDIPDVRIKTVIKAGVYLTFKLTDLFGGQLLQTIVTEKK